MSRVNVTGSPTVNSDWLAVNDICTAEDETPCAMAAPEMIVASTGTRSQTSKTAIPGRPPIGGKPWNRTGKLWGLNATASASAA